MDYLTLLRQSVKEWNKWRADNPEIVPILSRADLQGRDLQGANLSQADLSYADLSEADLSGANLSGATLYETVFNRAKLAKAELRATNPAANRDRGLLNPVQTLFILADLREADLSHSVFRGSYFKEAKLTGAILDRANLYEAHFDRADLSDAKVRNAYLEQADLVAAKLRNADMSGANLEGADLYGANLSGANLENVNLRRASFVIRYPYQEQIGDGTLCRVNLEGATLAGVNFSEKNLSGSNLSKTDLREVDLKGANLTDSNLVETNLSQLDLSRVDLSGSILRGSDFNRAYLYQANLKNADLREANLQEAILIETNLEGANLSGSRIYGIAAWRLQLENATQSNLLVSAKGEPAISVDHVEVAQFVYLLLNNEKIRDVIDTVGKKAVLILGRFTKNRKAVLNALRRELRRHGYLPILFDFQKPHDRDLTETISTLAHLARFIIADITDAKSIPQELQAIVPHLPSVAVQPIILRRDDEFAMFEHFTRYPWVLPVYQYEDKQHLLESFADQVINPAEAKVRELRR